MKLYTLFNDFEVDIMHDSPVISNYLASNPLELVHINFFFRIFAILHIQPL
jgi:hypothetical protein